MYLEKEINYMRRAIEIAEKGRGFTKTNPLVGVVLVKDEKIISEGYHHAFGKNHAEVNALNKVKGRAEGSTMYVTLEPCSHFGKTPPCANRIVDEKIKKVVISLVDPDKRVSGRGIKILKSAGVEVEVGMLEDEVKFQNRVFLTNKKKNRPFFTLKFATSLDGKIATSTGESKWITNENSRNHSHRLRAKVDGILVGKNTVQEDNPHLTNRSGEGLNPTRILLDSDLSVDFLSNIYNREAKTIVFTASDDIKKINILLEKGVEVIKVFNGKNGLDLIQIAQELLKKDIGHVLVEGGSKIHSSFIKAGFVDEIYQYISPILIGGGKSVDEGEGILKLSESLKFKIDELKNLDGDIFIRSERCLLE